MFISLINWPIDFFSPVNSHQGKIKHKIVAINLVTHNGSSGNLEKMRELSQHIGGRGQSVERGDYF